MRTILFLILPILSLLFSCKEKNVNTKFDVSNSIDTLKTSKTEIVATKSLKSTVMVIMEDANRQELAYGSGVIIDDNKIVTNKHVIENAYYGKVKKYGSDLTFSIKQVLAIDNLNDLAILEVSNLHKDVEIKFDTTIPNIGKKIYAVGNPKGLEGTFSEGIISGLRLFNDSTELIQISAPISPGSSGGQIIDEENQIIGIAVGGILDGQNLNFAIPAKNVLKLFSLNEEPQSLSSIKANKEKSKKKNLIAELKDEVIIKNLLWLKESGYDNSIFPSVINPLEEYSIYNGLNQSITDIKILFILYDRDNTPTDYSLITVFKQILPKLAIKIDNSYNYEIKGRQIQLDKKKGYKCVVRVLDFSIVK